MEGIWNPFYDNSMMRKNYIRHYKIIEKLSSLHSVIYT